MKLFISTILWMSFTFFPYYSYRTTSISDSNEPTLINSIEEDITGDGFREYITLTGYLLSNKSNYYRSVWVDINSPFSQQWKISFESGYDPSIELIDLTHDHVSDLFYKVAKEENKQQFDYQLYTLKNGELEQIPLPKHSHIQGKFLHNYKIELQIHPNQKPIIVDLSSKRMQYNASNLYDKKGNLQLEKKLFIHPITYIEPKVISESKGYALITYQPIKGIDQHDLLGEIKTIWYFKEGEWIAIKSEWVRKIVTE